MNQDFIDCLDKYQFLTKLKSIIADYPRKLQRFILISFIIDDGDLEIHSCFIYRDDALFSVDYYLDSVYLTKILNDSDIDLSLLTEESFLSVINSYGLEGFKKLYSNSEIKTFLKIYTLKVFDLLPLILKDADINDEFIVDFLKFFNSDDYEEVNYVFKKIEIDLVGCKRFFIVLKN